ncbi:50S ribosomal protein L4 [Buchnera aphidicola]|uniref:50S ribosomal protein L4 n=1 Tax=Buchnera aphidicola TaxID=9 RepID=UPI0030EBFADA
MNILLKDSKKNVLISKNIFNFPFNRTLIHQVITTFQTRLRKGTKAQKSRGEVSGSGKKPWRQKGTGRARVGSLRSPIWRSGGVTFAAKSKKYIKKVNKKMYKAAMKSILSELVRVKRLNFFKNFNINAPKTKILFKKLKSLNFTDVLIITHKLKKNLFLASRNLYKIKVIDTKLINPIDLLKFKSIIITFKALKKIEEIFE